MSKELQLLFGARAITKRERTNVELLNSNHAISESSTIVSDPNTILDLLRDHGTITIRIMDTIGADKCYKVAKDFAGVIANLIERVEIIERNEKNEPLKGHLPSALPQDFVKLKSRDLSALINIHRERMQPHWSDAEMDLIEQEHSVLLEEYGGQDQFRRFIDESSQEVKTVTNFEEGWTDPREKIPMLCRFAGGLETTFLGTSTVESDFSFLKWEKPASKAD